MNQDSIQKVYDEISQLQIELEPDPTILGPRYINEITARCRNHLNKVTLIRLRISREKRSSKSQLAGEETLLSAERDQLLAEDETVRRQPNLRDREAVANTILRDRLNSIAKLKNEIFDLDTVEKAVTLVHEELIRTSTEIRTQRSVMLADRVSGSGYGDEYDGPRDGKTRLPPSSIDEGELDRIMSGEAVEVPVEPIASVAPQENTDTSPATVESPVDAPESPSDDFMELPAELAAIGNVKSNPFEDEKLPEPVKVAPKTTFTDQAVKKADPSAGLPEDQDVLRFLSTEIKVEVADKPALSTKKAKVEDDDDFLSSLLQNI
jgi:hypothetical protein